MAKKFVLHSITIENDEQEIIARFNNSEDFSTYMIDLNMDLSRDDDEGYSRNYLDHIHIFHNVMLEDDEIHGLNEKQYNQLIQESQNV
ncbi:hypothetical protein [Leuconostoc mesenteroides]|uniref:hypothetical protein n=1 Tax=Leuconostoc mesenteroides TaxID=1245 RepID=UPI000E094999|nr:hypothetical protein [Leuconostoc mesenteroides]RDG16189.1 hypothetical protein DQM12_00630 [Leuconostoc mesenteroides subsp. mesenteroides]